MENKIVIDKVKETETETWKDKVEDIYWACRRYIRDNIFEPVWYRFFGHKHHIVKTGLTPAPWYDTDTRMLYAVMSLVEWFVENDMMTIPKQKYENEEKRIKKETPKEQLKDELNFWKEQYERDLEIMDIYKWWKNYPKRCKDIDKSLKEWSDYTEKLRTKYKMGGFLVFLNNKGKLTKQEARKENRLISKHHENEAKLLEEEQIYLKKAIDLRNYMWS